MKQGRIGGLMAAVAIVALVSACGEKEATLKGERIPLRQAIDGIDQAPRAQGAAAISLSAPQNIGEWAQRGGNARHLPPHAALSIAPQLAFKADIGAGSSRRARITAAPVVAAGRIFTMDAKAGVVATSTAGETLWSADLRPAFDRDANVSGGGLATDGKIVYATSGYGEVVALDATSGGVLWRQRVGAPIQGAPAVENGVIYVTGRDGGAWAIDAKNGKTRWTVTGTPGVMGYLGTAAPTVGDRLVYFPTGAGEIFAVMKESGGLKIWSEAFSGKRLGRAYAASADVTGDAALSGAYLYSGTAAGYTVAINAGDGTRVWTAPEGAMGPIVHSGKDLFLVNDEARLIRLDANSGKTIWSVEMPYFKHAKPTKHHGIWAHYGPVLAGGRIWVASSDGVLRGFSPTDGSLTYSAEIPGGAASQPAVAGATLYVVSNNGQLLAFR